MRSGCTPLSIAGSFASTRRTGFFHVQPSSLRPRPWRQFRRAFFLAWLSLASRSEFSFASLIALPRASLNPRQPCPRSSVISDPQYPQNTRCLPRFITAINISRATAVAIKYQKKNHINGPIAKPPPLILRITTQRETNLSCPSVTAAPSKYRCQIV